MADFTPPPRPKTAMDNKKLNLSVPCPADPSVRSVLSWQLHANNPRIVIFTNDPSDSGKDNLYGKITANLDLPILATFLSMLEDTINHDGEIKHSIDNKGHTFYAGKRSPEPEVLSTLWFGKDKDGVIWISVVIRDRPKIKFLLLPSTFHVFHTADGAVLDTSKVSQLFAKAYIRLIYDMFVQVASANYVEPEQKDNSWSKNRNNGGGNTPSNTSFDEELPF